MKKAFRVIREFFAHPIIQTALVIGASTIVLSHFSKRVFDEPLSKWELGLPALLGMFSEGLAEYRKTSRFIRPWVGMVIIVVTTALIIIFNMQGSGD